MFVTVNYCYYFVFEIVTDENILQSLVIFRVKVSIIGLLDTGHELNVHKYPKPSVCTFNLRLVCRRWSSCSIFPNLRLNDYEVNCQEYHCSSGSRKIAPSPNSNVNPKPNPDPDQGAIFLGGNFPDTVTDFYVYFKGQKQ